ncbi:MAG TPA: glycosyltransferase family 2 protein [Patescibacteria group bacterium]|nr:glycosyltransferase family 2 protein [Patescibacteria group bacterium]
MTEKEISVSVVIPSFNGKSLLGKNLPKVVAASKKSENRIKEIIIVDDGSVDDSVKYVKENFPAVKMIKHKVNRGFSAAVNTGVRSSTGSIILLLNNDVLPGTPFLAPALKHFDDPNVFSVSLHEKGYGWAKGSFTDGYINIGMGNESTETHTSFYVSGGSGLFRKSLWVELGGMDERLLSPFYWEDIDLCYRAAKRGFINLWEPEGNVIHKHESTIGGLPKNRVARIRERNQLLVIWKNVHSISFIRKHVSGLLGRVIRHPGYIRIVLMAILRLPSVLKARRREAKESKISDETIFSRFSEL